MPDHPANAGGMKDPVPAVGSIAIRARITVTAAVRPVGPERPARVLPGRGCCGRRWWRGRRRWAIAPAP